MPPRSPAPVFPPRAPRRFSRTPPAVFPAVLGLLGLGLALRDALAAFALPTGPADLLLGMAAMLWAFCVAAYLGKLAQRAGALPDDLRVLPGRIGLASASMGGMATAAALVPVAPAAALALLCLALATHAALALMLATMLTRLPKAARPVDPGWHLSFAGFLVGGIAASGLGLTGLATALLYAPLPVALCIWAASAVQMWRTPPPAALRPLLALHLVPAALSATVAALMGQPIAPFALALAAGILLALLANLRHITAAGFSPMWGAMPFPLAALASAFLLDGMPWAGLAILAPACILGPAIAWRIFKLWATGSLAAKTNAAQA